MKAILLAAAAALCIAAPAAADTLVFGDTFDAENGGIGAAEYSGFSLWTGANVDLLAPGYFASLCQLAGGSTPCVDMEGSGNGSLVTKAAYALAPGSVTMTFDLAGDQRGRSGNGVTVSLTSVLGAVLFSEAFNLPSDAGFTTFSRTITLADPTSARLGFLSVGPADSMGMLLDNVFVRAGAPVVSPIPEPETWAMLMAGLGLVGAASRRRRSRAAGAAARGAS